MLEGRDEKCLSREVIWRPKKRFSENEVVYGQEGEQLDRWI